MSAASAENEAVMMRWSTWMAAYSANGMQQYSPGPAMRLNLPKRRIATRSQWGATRTDEALSEAAQAFFDWATSEEANSLIEGAGAVPVAGTEAAA